MRAGWIAGIAWVGVGCVDAEQVLTATTDGGTWTVTVDGVPNEPGAVSLIASVEPADGAVVEARASMPAMGHASDAAIGGADGRFTLAIELAMSGWWVLDGAVSADGGDPDGAEGFELEFEVP
ncbi:MAG: hypothetical protein ABMB14_20060 [Myxococcota bacterium]